MSVDTDVEVGGFVPRWLRQRLRAGWADPQARIEPMRAAVLFADIVGFSALTREFSSSGDAGLEQLTIAVSDYFGRLFAEVAAAGGDIENTYGDGFLAFWTEEEDGIAAAARQAWQCALQLTRDFDRFGIGAGSEFRLRTAVLEGHVFAVKAGGAAGHWMFFLAGDCLSQVSGLLSAASPGGVALSSTVRALLGDAPLSNPVRFANRPPRPVDQGAAGAALPDSEIFPFLPRALRLTGGRLSEGWIAEFRLLSILFVRFPELQCRGVDDLQAIQAVIARLQAIVDRYEGATLRASMNDKGPFILCAFGLPQNVHEDDPQRAEAAARALALEFAAAGVAVRCTVTEGITYCGTIGRGAHLSYTTMGEAVNRAAKRVAASDQPELVVDLRPQSARRPATAALDADEVPSRRISASLIGRENELGWFAERIAALVAGSPQQAILIAGEAGIGKTTLLDEMARRAEGVTVLRSAADALIGSTSPYGIWRRIFGSLFATDGDAASAQLTETLRGRLKRQGEAESLVDLAGTVLSLAPSGIDAGRFSPADRARLTRAVLIALLKDRLSSEKVIVLLENAHWMDAASWALARDMAGQVPQALLVLSSRPLDEFEQFAGAACERLVLRPLGVDATQTVLAASLGCQGVSADVVQLVHNKAAGNPLFITQLGLALLESRVLAIDNGRLRFGSQAKAAEALTVSNTVHRVIVSRVDRLPAAMQQTLKAASVIGETFDLGTVHALVPQEDVAGHLDQLANLGLVRRLAGEDCFQFNHGVTREVMYRQMAFAQRRRLHELAANAFEQMRSRPADAILGHHWLRAENANRAIPYWERTGYASFTAGAFAEAAAAFEQALSCLGRISGSPAQAVRTARLYRHAGEACLQTGDVARSRQYLVEALAALGRNWPSGKLSTAAALANEMARQVLIELAPRQFGGSATARETAQEAAQIYESLGQVLGHTSELNLMGLATLAALNISQRCGSMPIYSRACGLFALVMLLMPIPALARRYNRHSREARPERGEPHDWLMTTEYLVIYRLTVADFDGVEAQLNEMIEVAAAAKNRRRRLDAMSLRNIALMSKGELDRCASLLAAFESEVLNDSDPQIVCWAHLEQAELALMRGDAHSALRQVDGCRDHLQTLGPNEQLWAAGLRALALWRTSRRDAALAEASTVLGLLRNPNEIAFYAAGGVFAASEVYLEASRTPSPVDPGGATFVDARTMIRRLRRFGTRLPICRPRTLMLLGCYRLARGRLRPGIALLRRARDEAISQQRPFEQALAVLQLAAAGAATAAARQDAMRCLREIGAAGLLPFLPPAPAAP